MSLPIYVIDKVIETDGDNKGYFTPTWSLLMEQLLSYLIIVIGDEGFKISKLTSTQIAQLNVTETIGTIVYNKTDSSFMGNVNGVFKTFTLT